MNTKAFVKFHVASADWLSDRVKTRLQEMVCNAITSYWTLVSHSQTTFFFDVVWENYGVIFWYRARAPTHTSNINKLCHPQNCSTGLKDAINFATRKHFPPNLPTLYQRKNGLDKPNMLLLYVYSLAPVLIKLVKSVLHQTNFEYSIVTLMMQWLNYHH